MEHQIARDSLHILTLTLSCDDETLASAHQIKEFRAGVLTSAATSAIRNAHRGGYESLFLESALFDFDFICVERKRRERD